MKRNWSRFFKRLLVATVIALLIAAAPLPVWTPAWFLHWQVPATVAVLVCYIGKLLIDTILFPGK